MPIVVASIIPARDDGLKRPDLDAGSIDPVMFLPEPGRPAAGPCIRTGRIVALAGTDETMPREPDMLISMPMAASVAERRRTERLSLSAAIFWIGFFSLGSWALIIALVLAVD
jgi:hypothetical protein